MHLFSLKALIISLTSIKSITCSIEKKIHIFYVIGIIAYKKSYQKNL